MEKIETWEEMEASGKWDDYGSMAREYARRHKNAALEAAKGQAKIIYNPETDTGSLYDMQIIDKDSILNAYPDENIK